MTLTSCHIVLTWREGEPARSGWDAAAKDAKRAGVPPPERRPLPAEVHAAFDRDVPRADVRLSAVLKVAQDNDLRTIYGPHYTYRSEVPILVDHAPGSMIGTLWDITRNGHEWRAEGLVHPDRADEARSMRFCSPGWLIVGADFDTFGDEPVLRVSPAYLAEVSLTAHPSREGTSAAVTAPKALHELPPLSYGRFRAHTEDSEIAWQARERERLRRVAL